MSIRGKRILVTRGGEQAEAFARLVREAGGTPVLFPTVRIVPADDPRPLDAALDGLPSFDWVLFTSANAARFFVDRAAARGIRALPDGVRAASVGPGTSAAMRRLGLPVHLEASRHTAEGLAEALAREGIAGKRYLLPRALEGREVLPAILGRQGGEVTAVAAYRTGLPERDEAAASALSADPPDVCTFASPSAFRNLFILMGEERAAAMLRRSRIAAIGEVTARAVGARNFPVDIMPETYTLKGMLEAIAARFEAPGTPIRQPED